MAVPYIVALQKSAEDMRRGLARALDAPAAADRWTSKILVADGLDHEALHRVQLALLDDEVLPPCRTLLLHRTPCPPAAAEPTSGSVSPNAPIILNCCIRGNHCCFCSSEPHK